MSKERAQRRLARQAEQEAAAAKRERQQARAARRPDLLGPRRPHDRRGRPDSVLARRRRRENAAVAFFAMGVLVVAWILLESWTARLAAVLLVALAVPVLVTLLFDRRS